LHKNSRLAAKYSISIIGVHGELNTTNLISSCGLMSVSQMTTDMFSLTLSQSRRFFTLITKSNTMGTTSEAEHDM